MSEPQAPERNPFSPQALALQAGPPALRARMVSMALCALTLLAWAYASCVSTDIVVTAPGQVIPAGHSKVLQSPEGGVVRRIAVQEGQAVRAGEVLVELDPTAALADRDRLQQALGQAQADAARLAALLAGDDRWQPPPGLPARAAAQQQALLASALQEHRARLAGLQAELARRGAERDATEASLAQLRLSQPLLQQRQSQRETLVRTGYVAESALIELRLETLRAERELAVQSHRLREAHAGIDAARLQQAQLDAEWRSRLGEQLLAAGARRDAAYQEWLKASDRAQRQVLRSPIDGIVQQLAVVTVGGVVTPAQVLMKVVPDQAALEVLAQVPNRDIGQLRVGQRALNKVEAFDFTRYGAVEGTVAWVGAEAVQDPRLGLVYPVRIRIEPAQAPVSAATGDPVLLRPGMNVVTEVATGQRRLIDYFLSPLLRHWQEALRER